jgi:drug/metabolite transporter (DMT)-like permease
VAAGAAGQLDGGVLAVLLWLGVFQLGFGYFSYQHGMRVVPAFQASLVSLIEPILNPVWVALAVGEVPSGATLAGGGLVLAGMTVGLALGRRSGPAKVAPDLPPPD